METNPTFIKEKQSGSSSQKSLELLAPAKNAEIGKIAINYGADAVYIGAMSFSARSAAGNSLQDIQQLINYAHRYHAKVYAAVNTILYDHELDEARELILRLYEMGTDAIIFQDFALLEMDLPPIALHASTQTNNFSLERIRWIDKLPVERIILARELSFDELKEIRENTRCELEFFIHGSLCVSLSGQCYMSYATTGRSANRGECCQACRHSYTLTDDAGKILIENKNLLSLKDMNLSAHLPELIDRGISSFKIEGRLKDEAYIKNVVSFYRKRLDTLIGKQPVYKKASVGKIRPAFTPDLQKTFSRSYTSYFINERQQQIASTDTPKSLGELIGKVSKSREGIIEIPGNHDLTNGDGICFISPQGLEGIRVNKVVNRQIHLFPPMEIPCGTAIYRNHNHQFLKALDDDKSIRHIEVKWDITFNESESTFTLTDEEGYKETTTIVDSLEKARDREKALDNIRQQLNKQGDSPFLPKEINIAGDSIPFIPISRLNSIRREMFEKLETTRTRLHPFKRREKHVSYPPFYKTNVSYMENITNRLSREFMEKCGVTSIEPGAEIQEPFKLNTLMTTRYCIKYEFGQCLKKQGTDSWGSPLYLKDRSNEYLLEFDCRNCMMKLKCEL